MEIFHECGSGCCRGLLVDPQPMIATANPPSNCHQSSIGRVLCSGDEGCGCGCGGCGGCGSLVVLRAECSIVTPIPAAVFHPQAQAKSYCTGQ